MQSFLSRDILKKGCKLSASLKISKNDINLTKYGKIYAKYGNIIISVKELKVNRVKKEGSNGEKKQTYFI
jgi:hypothetical protein